jgi:Flp pilus assembly protein TadG
MKVRQFTIRERRGKSRRGAVLVEFVFVLFLLLILLFGIIEIGLIMKNQATVALAAREAARSASVGSQPSVVVNRARNTATGITLNPNGITLEKSTNNGSSWTILTTSGSNNDAVTGDLVRATVSYTHTLITGFIYSGGSKTIRSTVVMRRE